MNGARGAREVVDPIDLHIERKCDVVALQFEVGVAVQMSDIALRSGKKIVDAQHIMAGTDQSIAQMGAEKTRSARDQNSRHSLRGSVGGRVTAPRRSVHEPCDLDHFGGIWLLMAFSWPFNTFCSDFVTWPPFWLAMSRSSWRTW